MEESRPEQLGPINLIKMNDTAYVWNSRDWLKLRSLRIVGSLVGNLATPTKQDRLGALPLSLLNEETTLLLEKGYAKLKILPKISDPPDEALIKRCTKQREGHFLEQAELLKEERKREIESKIDIIMQGKTSKRKITGLKVKSKPLSQCDVLREELLKAETVKGINLNVQICAGDPWLTENDMVDGEWPVSNSQKLNYLVFRDLWERGYYITLGGKFGGHFLAYPGDPVKFHAFFVIICIDKKKQLQMQDIVTYGRLAQSVRKTVILSYINDRNEINYQSVQWAGF